MHHLTAFHETRISAPFAAAALERRGGRTQRLAPTRKERAFRIIEVENALGRRLSSTTTWDLMTEDEHENVIGVIECPDRTFEHSLGARTGTRATRPHLRAAADDDADVGRRPEARRDAGACTFQRRDKLRLPTSGPSIALIQALTGDGDKRSD